MKCKAERGAGKANAVFAHTAAAGPSPALPPGASSGLLPSDTGPGGLPGRCWHCGSREALQTAQGKIFNLASHFNLKPEKN